MILSFCYNLFFVPIAICFDYELEDPGLWFVDVLAVVVYLLDIAVKFNSTLIYDNGMMERNKKVIANFYCSHILIMDALAALPVDYIAMTAGSAIVWIRILRLLKFFRVKEILK